MAVLKASHWMTNGCCIRVIQHEWACPLLLLVVLKVSLATVDLKHEAKDLTFGSADSDLVSFRVEVHAVKQTVVEIVLQQQLS